MAEPDSAIPLCVDLDGTLVRTDLLHESALGLLRAAPLDLARMPGRLVAGRSAVKHWIADRVRLEVAHLPYRDEVLALIAEARAAGRPVVLATAAAPQIAEAVAAHLGLFDQVVSSDAATNMSARTKAARLAEMFGERGFDYVGNSRADLPVWARARRVIVVSRSGRLVRLAAGDGQDMQVIRDGGTKWAACAKALRPHQWLKNLLVFVPLLAGQKAGDPALLLAAILAFAGFCAAASFGYIVNDLLDLNADRQHARKRFRPFASGALSLSDGIVLGGVLVAIAAATAACLPPIYAIVMLLYVATTLSYSIRLKQQVVLDVALLAGLYTLRIIAGAAATGIRPSFWLLAYSMFLFLSLAVVKRYTELRTATSDAPLLGRGYAASDLPVLVGIGTGSGLISVLVLALYVDTPTVATLYRAPEWLWLVPPVMLYWVTRLWMKTHRGEIHHDPVVFAARDRQSLAIAALLAMIFAAAARGLQPW